jgi:hypothetical protein
MEVERVTEPATEVGPGKQDDPMLSETVSEADARQPHGVGRRLNHRTFGEQHAPRR